MRQLQLQLRLQLQLELRRRHPELLSHQDLQRRFNEGGIVTHGVSITLVGKAVECLDLKVGHAVELLALTPLEQFPTLDVLVDPFLKPFPRVQHSFPRNILQG